MLAGMFGVKMVAVAADDDVQVIRPWRARLRSGCWWPGWRISLPRACRWQAGSQLRFRGLELAGLVMKSSLPVVIGVLGSGVVVLFGCQEQWIGHRPGRGGVQTGASPVSSAGGATQGEGRDRLLAESAEELLTPESAAWADERAG
jgi:hypothetical protein